MNNKPVASASLSYGLTLVELVITMAVLAVLLSISIPSFTPLIERWRTNQALSELESILFYARSEGIRRGGNLSLTRISDNSNCASTTKEWQCGWQLIQDSNQDGMSDSGTAPIKTNNSFNKIIISASDLGNKITIDRWGKLSLLDGDNSVSSFSFSAYPPSKLSNEYPKLCIKSGGHLIKIKASDSCNG